MSFFYGSEKSRNFSGIDSISGKVPKSSRPKYQELYFYRLSGTKMSDIVITNFYCPEGTTRLINGALGKKLLPTFEVQPYREYLKQII